MKYLITLISFILLLGCTKVGKNMTIKGRAVNPITGEGIPGARVFLSRSKLDIGSATKIVKETTTDENGSFEISKLSLSHCYLHCDPSVAGDYYQIGWEQKKDVPLFDAFTISVKKGKTMHADYYAIPYGNIKSSIINTSCFDQNDKLVLDRDYQLSNLTSDYTGSSIYDGCFEFIGTVYSKKPMGWHYIRGTCTKNNVTTIFTDSIYIETGGFHEWIIEY